MSNDATAPRVAWVTGASRGIGAGVARRLAEEGWVVAASARDSEDLQALAGAHGAGRIDVFPLDITDMEAAEAVFDRIESELGPVSLAILNAGTHQPIDGTALEVAPFRKLVEINLMGTVHCLAPVVSRFKARGAGRIAVVASIAGYRGLPTSSGYGATKAGLINMCEALRPELERVGVILSCVTPGFVKTPLTDKNPFPMPFLIDVETAAERIVRGLETDRFEITFPRRFAYIMKFLRILPYRLFFAATRRIVPDEGAKD